VSWWLPLVGEQDAPMNMFGHKWDQAISASVSVSVTPQSASVEPNGKSGKHPTTLCFVHKHPTTLVSSATCLDASDEALVLTRLMRHLSWAAWMRLQDKWSMHACA